MSAYTIFGHIQFTNCNSRTVVFYHKFYYVASMEPTATGEYGPEPLSHEEVFSGTSPIKHGQCALGIRASYALHYERLSRNLWDF